MIQAALLGGFSFGTDMATDMNLTLARLKELLHYDPETGAWTRTTDRLRGGRAGTRADNVSKDGYCYVSISRRPFLAHRLAWLWVYGAWPKADIDHADGNRSNNRISNLREATRSQNIFATRNRAQSLSGIRGVKQVNRRWSARIRIDGHLNHIGYFSTKEEARSAYEAAAVAHFGEFSNVLFEGNAQ